MPGIINRVKYLSESDLCLYPLPYLNEYARYTLQAHSKDGRWTFFVDVPITIPNRVLGLDREQETGHETIDICNTRFHGFRGITTV